MSVQEIWGHRHSLLEGGRGRQVRFRPERYDARALPLRARVAGTVYQLANFSRGGVAILCDGTEALALGCELRLELELRGVVQFSARATAVHQTQGPQGLVVGLEFLDQVLDVDRFFAVHAAEEMASRLVADMQLPLVRGAGALPVELRALLADARLMLETWRARLRKLEAEAAGNPQSATHQKAATRTLLDRLEAAFVPDFLDFVRRFDALSCTLPGELEPACRAYSKGQLLELLLEAPVLRRAFEKPFGYAGDFLVMLYFYTDHDLGDSLFARLLHRASCQVTAARAVSSRVGYLKEKIRAAQLAFGGERLRVLSIGCGAAQEVQELVSEQPEACLDFSLIDQDRNALDHCHRRFSALLRETAQGGPQVQVWRLSVLQLLRGRGPQRELQGQHLIYAAGLFDYLELGVARRLLETLAALLAPGGQLVVGNFDFNCDTRGVMKYLLDWDIIYRSRDDLIGLLPADPSLTHQVEAEGTGVNLFLVLAKETLS